MLKKYGFFILLYFIAMLVEAKTFEEEMRLTPKDFKKQQCAILKNNKITQGSCLIYTSLFRSGRLSIIKFNGTAYRIVANGCTDYCKVSILSSEEDRKLSDGEAKDLYRDKNFKIVKIPSAKYHCFKRKKHNKPVYELCTHNVS